MKSKETFHGKLHIVTFGFMWISGLSPAQHRGWTAHMSQSSTSHRSNRPSFQYPLQMQGKWREITVKIQGPRPNRVWIPSIIIIHCVPDLYWLKLNLWPFGVGGWRRLCPFKVSEAPLTCLGYGHDQGTQASGGLVLSGVTVLSPLFFPTFPLFGNRGLRPNSTSKVSLFAEILGWRIYSMLFLKPGLYWSDHSLDSSGVAGCWGCSQLCLGLLFRLSGSGSTDLDGMHTMHTVDWFLVSDLSFQLQCAN